MFSCLIKSDSLKLLQMKTRFLFIEQYLGNLTKFPPNSCQLLECFCKAYYISWMKRKFVRWAINKENFHDCSTKTKT